MQHSITASYIVSNYQIGRQSLYQRRRIDSCVATSWSLHKYRCNEIFHPKISLHEKQNIREGTGGTNCTSYTAVDSVTMADIVGRAAVFSPTTRLLKITLLTVIGQLTSCLLPSTNRTGRQELWNLLGQGKSTGKVATAGKMLQTYCNIRKTAKQLARQPPGISLLPGHTDSGISLMATLVTIESQRSKQAILWLHLRTRTTRHQKYNSNT